MVTGLGSLYIKYKYCELLSEKVSSFQVLYCVSPQDEGDQFTYTGSGGRDLSGNKRTAEQSCDQTLTRMNK